MWLSRLNKIEHQTTNNTTVINWCMVNKVKWEMVNDWQIRLTKQGNNGGRDFRIDIYTQSKKFHNITTNNRGRISTKIVDFLNASFK